MFSRSPLAVLILTPLLSVSFLTAPAQSQSQNQPAGNQAFTIQANSRVVLTDVTVIDREGNPVHGLPASAFRIFDNNQPQATATFEEHTGIPAATLMPTGAPTGTYSNDYLLHLPPALNVILVDIANLQITDQMYLYYELTTFFKKQPDGQHLPTCG
jgi:VWFA-related protein